MPSALSAVLTLAGANPSGGDFTYPFDRPDDTQLHIQSYESPNPATQGQHDLALRFYAQAGGAGDVVAVAYARVTIWPDGSGIGDLTTVGRVTDVEVPSGQTVDEGQTKDLAFTARDPDGKLLALTVGSASWGVTGGSQFLSFQEGRATGLQHGSASVVVTIDGKASTPQKVRVTVVPQGLLLPLLPGAPEDGTSQAFGLSGAGDVVVGEARDAQEKLQAFRWTEAGGTKGLGFLPGYDAWSIANAVSGDGSVVVGESASASASRAFIGRQAGGMQPLGDLPEGTTSSVATGISADGSVVVGYLTLGEDTLGFVWTEAGGYRLILDLSEFLPQDLCQFRACSRDGRVAVGTAAVDLDAEGNFVTLPVRWSAEGGLQALWEGTPEMTDCAAYCVNADGSVAGGYAAASTSPVQQPFRWTVPGGFMNPAPGWMVGAHAVTADGEMIAGGGADPGMAFLWDTRRGFRNLLMVLEQLGLVGEIGGPPFGVNALSDDGQCMAGVALVEDQARAFLVRLP
jgi:uncharacterized membrane protein